MSRHCARVFLACALIALPMRSALCAALSPASRVTATVAAVQAGIAEAAAPATTALRSTVQNAVPMPAIAQRAVSPAAVDLIIRWEVSGEANYRRNLSSPIWPGGASGITWGIGYDAGYSTVRDIRAIWSDQADVERLAGAAGIAGDPARAALPGYADIVVPWALATQVFAGRSLPVYRTSARRAFGAEFDGLPADAQGALVSLVYNRGGEMAGTRNAEKRAIRDRCLPAVDARCIGAQLRAMCRLWAGTPNGAGLCRRREDEARLAEGAA